MVSFFGLKFGSGHKKSQNKQPKPVKTIDSQSPYGNASNNYSRPNIQIDRPGTASSSTTTTPWKKGDFGGGGGGGTPYLGKAATSSMIDLAPPRRVGEAELRHRSSDMNLRARGWGNGSSLSVAIPDSATASGKRPITATTSSPVSGKKKEWVNPLDVHFARDNQQYQHQHQHQHQQQQAPQQHNRQQSGPETPQSATARQASLGEFNFGLPDKNDGAESSGYPSPPSSANGSISYERSPSFPHLEHPSTSSSTNSASGQRRNNGPSGLRNVDTLGPASPPSPATTAPRTSDEQHHQHQHQHQQAVIRDVAAKRDALTCNQPRLQSMTSNIEEETAQKRAEERRKEELRLSVGLSKMGGSLMGSLAAFDFGEGVRNSGVEKKTTTTTTSTSTAAAASHPFAPPLTLAHKTQASKTSLMSLDTVDSGISPTDTRKPCAFDMRRPATSHQSASFTHKPSTENSSVTSLSLAQGLTKLPNMDKVPSALRIGRRSSSPEMKRITRAVSEATPVLAPALPISTLPTLSMSEMRRPSTAGRLTASPSFPPARPTEPLPLTVLKAPSALPCRPETASGASSATSMSSRPGYMSRPLDPPPRGIRSRFDASISSAPSPPPTALRAPPPVTDRPPSLNSPNTSTTTFAKSSSIEYNQPSSPCYRSPPLEGKFPISKGLPRGRRPQLDRTSSLNSIRDRQPDYPPPPPPPASSSSSSQRPNQTKTPPPTGSRTSAIPPPLSPFRSHHVFDLDLPPQLPSPSFDSLAMSISSSSESLRRAFESWDKPLISPVMSEFGPRAGTTNNNNNYNNNSNNNNYYNNSNKASVRDKSPTGSLRRIEMRAAPPRPSPDTPGDGNRSPATTVTTMGGQFSPTFL